ncbi:hypothetical protein E3Q24_04427 [Wallemia mellicola]|nr:hypothetical protein E3Q24_04427 [Wallemia mellicola]TIC48853.1 hypothetical protein E3Q04_04438 [Wallemia mellicola]
MYLREVHAEDNLKVLKDLIKSVKLGQLTTAIESNDLPFLQTTPIPFTLMDTPNNEKGILTGHLARANPQAKALIEASNTTNVPELERDVLIFFTSDANSYVTPKYYVKSKPETGKVVPTWNYAAVQVYGRIKVHHAINDTTSAFLQSQITQLTNENEAAFETQWKVSDAPNKYFENLKKAIIGVEINIHSINGKFKYSQEMPEEDRLGVIAGFENAGDQKSKNVANRMKQAK